MKKKRFEELTGSELNRALSTIYGIKQRIKEGFFWEETEITNLLNILEILDEKVGERFMELRKKEECKTLTLKEKSI